MLTDSCLNSLPSPAAAVVVRTSSDTLSSDVAAFLPVLPILAGQLEDTLRHVEQSVVHVCHGFQNIVERANTATAGLNASSSQGTSAIDRVSSLVGKTRSTLEQLLERVQRASRNSVEAADRIEHIERGMKEVARNLRHVDDLAEGVKLVSLNGRIEATRAGEHAAPFAIVAQETARLAECATQTSNLIQHVVGDIYAQLELTSNQLRTLAAATLQEAELSRQEVVYTLDVLEDTHRDLQQTVQLAASSTQQLTADVTRAVMAMQFQDAMNQRVSSVVASLREFHELLSARLTGQQTLRGRTTQEWIDHMAGRYVMQAERETLQNHLAQVGEEQDVADGGVELF